MIKVVGVICPKCNDLIYSRARHDFHYCSCGNLYCDGGMEFLRYGAVEGFAEIRPIVFKIKATVRELYDDWNKDLNIFGLLKEPTYEPKTSEEDPADSETKRRRSVKGNAAPTKRLGRPVSKR